MSFSINEKNHEFVMCCAGDSLSVLCTVLVFPLNGYEMVKNNGNSTDEFRDFTECSDVLTG